MQMTIRTVECSDQADCDESLRPVTRLIFVMLWQEPSDMYLKSLIKRQLFFFPKYPTSEKSDKILEI